MVALDSESAFWRIRSIACLTGGVIRARSALPAAPWPRIVPCEREVKRPCELRGGCRPCMILYLRVGNIVEWNRRAVKRGVAEAKQLKSPSPASPASPRRSSSSEDQRVEALDDHGEVDKGPAHQNRHLRSRCQSARSASTARRCSGGSGRESNQSSRRSCPPASPRQTGRSGSGSSGS